MDAISFKHFKRNWNIMEQKNVNILTCFLKPCQRTEFNVLYVWCNVLQFYFVVPYLDRFPDSNIFNSYLSNVTVVLNHMKLLKSGHYRLK